MIALSQNGENIIELACMEVSVLLERINSLSASEWKDYYEGLIEGRLTETMMRTQLVMTIRLVTLQLSIRNQVTLLTCQLTIPDKMPQVYQKG